MKQLIYTSLIYASLFMCLSFAARAELVMVDSVEVLTARADVVAVGQLGTPEVVKGPKTHCTRSDGETSVTADYRRVTLQVTEAIKGSGVAKSKPLTFVYRTFDDTKVPKGRVLVFLSSISAKGSKNRQFWDCMNADWVVTRHNDTFDGPFLSLEKTPRTVSRSLRMLESPRDILSAVRSTAKLHPKANSRTFALDTPPNSEVYGAFYSGSAVEMLVPVDADLQRWAEARLKSKSTANREQAAQAMSLMRSKKNIAHLRSLLNDPGFWAQRTSGVPGGHRLYPVRRAAYKALKNWGIKVTKPVIREPFQD